MLEKPGSSYTHYLSSDHIQFQSFKYTMMTWIYRVNGCPSTFVISVQTPKPLPLSRSVQMPLLAQRISWFALLPGPSKVRKSSLLLPNCQFPLFPRHLFPSHLLLLMCRLCLILDYNTPKDKRPLLDLFILHNTVNKQIYKQHVLNKNLVKNSLLHIT